MLRHTTGLVRRSRGEAGLRDAVNVWTYSQPFPSSPTPARAGGGWIQALLSPLFWALPDRISVPPACMVSLSLIAVIPGWAGIMTARYLGTYPSALTPLNLPLQKDLVSFARSRASQAILDRTREAREDRQTAAVTSTPAHRARMI